MFNPEWEHPLEMFSWQHFVALAVVLAIFLIVFLFRKFFMRCKIADRIFRYSLGIGLITFELILQLHNGLRPLFGRIFADTYPLCGYMIWFCAIALISNNAKLMKLIYPLTITGGTLSLIVIDMNCTFPHFGAFQFWFVHAGFMLGTLYFFFTKKISRYTIKDLGRSCIFLFSISIYVLLIGAGKLMLNKNFKDPLFLISPPGGLESVKNALGQTGYTIVYILLIVSILFAIYGITYLCTRKRDYNDIHNFEIKENKVLNFMTKCNLKLRYIILLVIYGLGLYSVILYRSTQTRAFLVLEVIFFFALIISSIVNEILTKYEREQKNKNQNNDINQK